MTDPRRIPSLPGLLVGDPTNVETVSVFDSNNVVVFRSDEADIGPMALQQGKPVEEIESPEDGYAACLHFITAAGQRIGTLSGDVTQDGHNHIGIYTNAGLAEDGSDRQPTKRLNIGAGEDTTAVDWYAIDTMHIGPRTGDDDSKADHILESTGDSDATYRVDNDGDIKGMFLWSDRHGETRIVGMEGETTDLRMDNGGGFRIKTGGPDESGELLLGDDGARVYCENGHVVAENADGETNQIV